MNPNTPQPSFELPVPQPQNNEEVAPPSNEWVAARPETYTQPPAAQPAPLQQSQAPQPSMPPQAQVPQAPQPQQAHSSASPTVADDSDLIEKEWVIKAKQIVAATREDPHMQNKEISRFKADYLKKRYNKDIKLEES